MSAMHFNMSTVMIVAAFAAAVFLLLNRTDRLFPMIAVIAAGIELLLALGIMSLSLSKYRIDVILPALLVVSGIIIWSRSSEKGSITAATTLSVIGAMQLLLALRIF